MNKPQFSVVANNVVVRKAVTEMGRELLVLEIDGEEVVTVVPNWPDGVTLEVSFDTLLYGYCPAKRMKGGWNDEPATTG